MSNWMDHLERRTRRLTRQIAEIFILALAGIVIGIIVSLFEVLFVKVLNQVTWFHQNYGNCLWLFTLPIIGMLIVWMFERFGGKARQGISLVFKVNQGTEKALPKRIVFMMMISTWLSHLAGASVGKEGVGMQIGAVVSNAISRQLPYFRDRKTIFLITGMAAGFSGLFGTPFTAVFFAMEVLVSGVIEYRALAPALAASLSAAEIAKICGLGKEAFSLPYGFEMGLIHDCWKLAILGIVFGLVGGFFAWCMHQAHHYFGHSKLNPYYRIAFFSMGLGLLLWIFYDGRYSGSGVNLITYACTGGQVYPWDFALKFGLSVLSLSMGFIGGEVTPLFAIGASLGAVLGPRFGYPPVFGAALGYAAVFGAGTNTWLAAMMVGMEIFGMDFFPFFFVCCSAAYLANGNLSIYSLQRKLDVVFKPIEYPNAVNAANRQVEDDDQA